MKIQNKHLLLLFLPALLLLSCSSLPKKDLNYNPLLNEADQLMLKANQMENTQAWKNAYYYYNSALNKYLLTDEQFGALKANIALARQEFYLKNYDDYETRTLHIEKMLLKQKNETLSNEFALLKMECFYLNSQYDSVFVYSKKIQNPNDDQELRENAWKCLSALKKKTSNQHYFDKLLAKSESAYTLYKKGKFDHAKTLSFAFYTIGLNYHEKKQFRDSIKKFFIAYKIDKTEQNFHNLATDLYFIAFNYEYLNDYDNAGYYYQRSYLIAQQIMSPDKAAEIEFKYLSTSWLYDKNPATIQKMINLKNRTENEILITHIIKWLSDK